METDLSIVQKLLEKHQIVFVEESKDQEDEDDCENCLNLYAISGRDLLGVYNKDVSRGNTKEISKMKWSAPGIRNDLLFIFPYLNLNKW